ncbi:divergent polysaccharide deacetylase family protein [Dongia sp.]|uniref:divergent polysaccharide deacetylase family protein n=1 Tax=Dongia sp. TaxID=1977262 RepID=UPI0035B3DFA5
MAKAKKPARKKSTRSAPRRRKSASSSWLRHLPGGTLLFGLGIALGLGLGVAATLVVPGWMHSPKREAVVAEGAARLPKSTVPATQKKVPPSIVEKQPATDVAAVPASAPTPLPPQPAVAEEGQHQSTEVTEIPAEEPAQVAAAPSPSAKEPSAPKWLENAVAFRDPGNRPMIAIVLDDVGVAPQHAELALDLPAPIVLSIMTYAKNASALARAAHAKGHEVMVHMPMQPVNATVNPGPNALNVGMDSAELRRRIDWGLGRLDGYVGFNNHMGSRFTQDPAGMRVVLEEAKERGLLFLDSKTIAGSVGDRMAAEMGVTHIARDVFLDDDMSEAAVARQLVEAERIARKQGYAVAIGHPHPGTIAVLKRWLPAAKAQGFAIVPLTAIVKKREGVAG